VPHHPAAALEQIDELVHGGGVLVRPFSSSPVPSMYTARRRPELGERRGEVLGKAISGVEARVDQALSEHAGAGPRPRATR
jgi:hypothetical protein